MSRLVLHERTKKLVDHLSGNLPHGLVVDGPVGVGVRMVAEQLADSMGSPLLVIKPKKSVGGQLVIDEKEGSVVIDDIRDLYGQTRTKQPGAQVYIIDTGERSMTPAAQNAFLKLLEEPRPGLYFIIATHFADQLLPTIKSRTQQLSVLPISGSKTNEFIETFAIDDPTKKARLAFVGRGLPALIARLAGDDKAYDKRVMIMSDAKTMIGGTPYDKLATAHRYRENRMDAITLLDDMNHQLRVIIQKTPDPSYASAIARNLDARSRITLGGNIRLQLSRSVL